MLRRALGCFAVALSAAGCAQQVPAPSPAPSVTPTTAARSSTPLATTTVAAPPFIDHVAWTSDSKGRMLRVYPTASGRTATGDAALGQAWQEVLRAAPTSATASMADQFRCHWEFARIVEPNKTSWNLEAWRLDVGYAATVQAACNPGGPE
ncbi:MAG: DUF2599 domain-containing protein [Mycobacteriaceae bacterium]